MYGGMSRNKFIVSLVSKNETNSGSSSSRTDGISNSLLEINNINNNDALAMNINDENISENCIELQNEIDEAIKVLMVDAGEQNDELLLLLNDQVNVTTKTAFSNTKINERNTVQDEPKRCDIDIAEVEPPSNFVDNQKPCDNDTILLIGDQMNGTTASKFSNTNQGVDESNNVQEEPEQYDIDIAEAGPSGGFMGNKKRCDNDQNYIPTESESESEYEESEDEYLDMAKQLRRKEIGAGDSALENNGILVENTEEAYNTQPKRKRKRKPDTGNWKRQESKIKRQKGKKYDGFRKNPEGKWTIDVAKPPREMKPFCNCKILEKSKKIQCRIFTEEDRQHIFSQFWQNMTWPEKKIYVSSLVDTMAPKDLKNRINETSRRSKTFVCHLKKNGVRVRVCQVMFINTLNLGTWSLHNWVTSSEDRNEHPDTDEVNFPHRNRINTRHESGRIGLRK